MIKQMFKMIIEPSWHIEEIRNKYGDIASFSIFSIITILYMFLNVVVYDKTLENTLLTLEKAALDSIILGVVVSFLVLFLISFILKLLFSLKVRKITAKTIRSCIAWGSIPAFLGNLISIVIRVIFIYNVDDKIMFKPLLWSSIPIFLITMISVIWSILIIVICLKEIQNMKKENIIFNLLITIMIIAPLIYFITNKTYLYIMMYVHHIWE